MEKENKYQKMKRKLIESLGLPNILKYAKHKEMEWELRDEKVAKL